MIGEKGFVDVDPAFAYYGLRLKLNDGKGAQDLQLKPVNHFAAEMDHFSRCILDGTEPRTPGNEGLADMRVITAIEQASKSGRAAKV
jgi:predicted dehydrogenase